MATQAAEKTAAQEQPKTARAVARYLRGSPRKVRLVIDTIRHKPVHQAVRILGAMKTKGARQAEKLLKSAMANAKVLGMDENRLIVSTIVADGGPTFKRFMSRSMGRADRILKRTTHLTITLKEGTKNIPLTGADAAREAEAETPEKKKGKKKAAAAA